MAIIKVPKTPKRAFNPDRPPSGLLRAQVEHLEAAARSVQGGLPQRKVRTEGQAALYIQQLTAQLYPHDVPVPEPDGSPLPAPRTISGPPPRPPRKAARKAKVARKGTVAARTAAKKGAKNGARKAAKKAATRAAKRAAKKGPRRGVAARAGKRKTR